MPKADTDRLVVKNKNDIYVSRKTTNTAANPEGLMETSKKVDAAAAPQLNQLIFRRLSFKRSVRSK